MAEKRNYRDEIAEEIIARIEAGTAPWQKPWTAGAVGAAPFNPVSGKPYRGINDVWLTLQGRADPRWLTYNQALARDAQVRKGERSATIEYWQWTAREPMVDGDGTPVLDAEGKQRMAETRLDRPRVFYAKVFNAEQIDGLAPWTPPAPSFDPVARAETLLTGAGVPLHHDQSDRAFYSPLHDDIHLPAKAAFRDAAAYYGTALHELGHATGHGTRLARPFGPFGSEGYAREELRAEIASYMLSRDLGISFDPGNHAAYVESWLKALREDRHEIFRAARDAETIKTWVMEPDRRPELERAARLSHTAQTRDAVESRESAVLPDPEENAMARPSRHYLAVPFAEKDEAKAAGAKWDRSAKSWYVPAGRDVADFARWAAAAPAPAATLPPVEEFAQALKDHGLLLKGAPVMDGRWHRVPVEGDHDKTSGSYRGFLDGRPSGQITNYKAGGTVKWVATGAALTEAERARIQAEAAQIRADRAAARLDAAEKAARTAYGIWSNLPAAATPATCSYLAAKGVEGHGVKVTPDGAMVVPCRDSGGKLWNVQFVGADGKHFLKDSLKAGTMHVIEPTGAGTLAALAGRGGPVLMAEGYATAARIFEATARPVVVAFDSGNLAAVAEAIRTAFPDRAILICADNDHANIHGNVGLDKAEAAAQAVGASVIAPKFTAEEMARSLTDFDDLGKARGNGAVRQAVESALARCRERERGIA